MTSCEQCVAAAQALLHCLARWVGLLLDSAELWTTFGCAGWAARRASKPRAMDDESHPQVYPGKHPRLYRQRRRQRQRSTSVGDATAANLKDSSPSSPRRLNTGLTTRQGGRDTSTQGWLSSHRVGNIPNRHGLTSPFSRVENITNRHGLTIVSSFSEPEEEQRTPQRLAQRTENRTTTQRTKLTAIQSKA